MHKFIIFLLITSCNYAAYEAKKITVENISTLETIDKNLFVLASKKNNFKLNDVANFILRNLAYKRDYSLLKITARASARAIANKRDTTTTQEQENRLKAEILLTYPIFSPKEKYEKRKKIIETKQKIFNDTKKYFEIKADLTDLEIQKLIILKLETRNKTRKLTAVGAFEDWLKSINDLRKINKELTDAEINLNEARLILLSYVFRNKQNTLKEML